MPFYNACYLVDKYNICFCLAMRSKFLFYFIAFSWVVVFFYYLLLCIFFVSMGILSFSLYILFTSFLKLFVTKGLWTFILYYFEYKDLYSFWLHVLSLDIKWMAWGGWFPYTTIIWMEFLLMKWDWVKQYRYSIFVNRGTYYSQSNSYLVPFCLF